MPDIVWPASWAILGLLAAVWALKRAWVQQRSLRRELAAVHRYGELREGEYAALEGTVEKIGRGEFDLVMESREKVRIEPELRAKVEPAIWARTEEIVAERAERPVYVSGIVERVPTGFALRVVPYRRMIVSTVPLWKRAARRRIAHMLIAFAAAGLSLTLFRFLAWDALRLTLDGEQVHATLTSLEDIDEERFSLFALGFRKVRKARLEGVYTDNLGRTHPFAPVVDPKAEWLWPLRARKTEPQEAERLGIGPVDQTFLVLPENPSVCQLGDRVRIEMDVALIPLALLVLGALLYWLLLVRPELPPRYRNPRHALYTPPGNAA
jgi:hypothetical protein